MSTGDRTIKGHCPKCGKGRKAFVRGEHVVEHPDDGDGVTATDTGMILECCGCETVYFRRDYWLSEWDEIDHHPVSGEEFIRPGIQTTYWPSEIARLRPDWIDTIRNADEDLANLMEEMYSALDSNLRVLAAIGIRTVFDRASELLGVDAEKSFKAKLDSLGADGKISIDEHGVLETLVDAASASAHRGWRPGFEDIRTMMEVIEPFLHRSFIVGHGIEKLKASVPPRKRERHTGPGPAKASPSDAGS